MNPKFTAKDSLHEERQTKSIRTVSDSYREAIIPQSYSSPDCNPECLCFTSGDCPCCTNVLDAV
jgi:hypothetical protein